MPLSHKFRLVILLLVLGCTVGCDQTSKHFARIRLGESGFVTLPGGFGELRLAQNPGSFLSLGASLPESLRLTLLTFGVGAGLCGILIYLVVSCRLRWLSFAGLALVWAGGTSNLIDRITRHGRVSDFIFIQVGPFHTGIFNVADVVIMLGFAALAWELWKQRHNPASEKSKPERS